MSHLRIGSAALAAGALILPAFADGTETLGTPTIGIADGTNAILAGIGFAGGQPDTVNVNVPAGVTILQVIAYWEGFALSALEQGATDTIQMNAINVTGDRIGGPSEFIVPQSYWTSTYRADITHLNLVSNGANAISVSGLDFGFINNGLGLVVIVDDPAAESAVGLLDGNDAAFINFASPFDTTTEVSFSFPASTDPRNAELGYLVGSVSSVSSAGPDRPTIIEIGFDGAAASVFGIDLFGLNAGTPPGGTHTYDGDWDVLTHPISVPAGATSVELQLLSADSGIGPFAGELPASLVWVASTFTLETPEDPPPGGEGCTPGYWKNHLLAWAPTGYAPGDNFDTVFGVNVFGDLSLLRVLRLGGGGEFALGRHAVAALLNAAHPDLDYGIATPAEVIAAVQAAYQSGDADVIEDLKDELDELNNAGCFDRD